MNSIIQFTEYGWTHTKNKSVETNIIFTSDKYIVSYSAYLSLGRGPLNWMSIQNTTLGHLSIEYDMTTTAQNAGYHYVADDNVIIS